MRKLSKYITFSVKYKNPAESDVQAIGKNAWRQMKVGRELTDLEVRYEELILTFAHSLSEEGD
jgi:hypothetical protein